MWKRKKKRKKKPGYPFDREQTCRCASVLTFRGTLRDAAFRMLANTLAMKVFLLRPRQECTQRQTCGVIWPSPNRNYHRWDIGEGRSGPNQTGQASRQSGESGEGRGRGRAVILRYTAGIKMTQWLQIRKKYTILVSKNRPTKLKRV